MRSPSRKLRSPFPWPSKSYSAVTNTGREDAGGGGGGFFFPMAAAMGDTLAWKASMFGPAGDRTTPDGTGVACGVGKNAGRGGSK